MIDAVGVAAALCSMSSFVPQVVKIWRERDAGGVSLRMYVVTVTGFGLWTAYGMMLGSWPLVGSNATCLGLSAAILALKVRFDREAASGQRKRAADCSAAPLSNARPPTSSRSTWRIPPGADGA
ncbi:MAG TPA: SemiSWEET transporter [Caulobacteraceae bacterium]|nr:SemiSWEET transporter [Caulobacteraceae bacterium]